MVQHEVTSLKNGNVEVSGNCVITGKPHKVVVPKDGYKKFLANELLIQDCFPTVSADEREFIKSGISPEGWELIFNEEE